eukprot:356820-Chlamydomonas_euryale.AAC.3
MLNAHTCICLSARQCGSGRAYSGPDGPHARKGACSGSAPGMAYAAQAILVHGALTAHAHKSLRTRTFNKRANPGYWAQYHHIYIHIYQSQSQNSRRNGLGRGLGL